MLLEDDFEPSEDDLAELEDGLDEPIDEDDLDELLAGIEDDDYVPEDFESLDALAEDERDRFDYYAEGGAGWDEVD